MAGFDLDWLVVFDEVYKTSSVSRAAERLGIAQASASIALGKLREQFNDRLFCRTARGMQPTPRAQELYPVLRKLLSELEQARSSPQVFDPASSQRTFRICMTDISEIVILPRLLNHLRSVAPGLRIDVEKLSTATGRRLEDGEADVAVGFMPQLEAGFYQTVLFEQNFVCLVAQDHPRIGARMTKATYARESHIRVSASGTGHAIVDKVLEHMGVVRRIAVNLPSFLSVPRIAAETELIATVPIRFAQAMQAREEVRMVGMPYALPSYAIKQHWHERFNSDPGNIWLRRTLAQLLS